MRLNWVLLPREPGSASFYGVFKQGRIRSPVGRSAAPDHFLAGFAGVAAVA